MGLRRTSLVLYTLLFFHLQHNLPSVSSRPYSVDTYQESLPLRATKPDVVGFEGKAQELAVVIKKGGGGGGGGGGRGGGSGRGGRGGSVVPVIIPINSGGHHSSGIRNIGGGVCTVCWLSLSVLAGLLLV
ncbi:unnamed protein product [Eruca vesicaria subsp. sativa]|uniref:Glycine-rich protein n=1 Tax=Eruca vesicaria subsp. sativa TaxID=29727 RepID=A0ABC8JT18_ERUVS|nr:unnamed protein product [Eruca vesicaria subsp. sativa]